MKSRNKNRLLLFWLLFGIMWGAATGSAQNRPQRNRNAQAQMDVLYLTQEQEAEVIAYIKEYSPDRLDELLAFKERRPAVYRRGMSRFYREMRFLMDIKKRDPDKYQQLIEEKNLEMESRLIARQYRAAEDENDKIRLREELSVTLRKAFDLRQLNRQIEIERLEQKLLELQEQNRRRLANKDEIVEKRINDMIGAANTLEW